MVKKCSTWFKRKIGGDVGGAGLRRTEEQMARKSLSHSRKVYAISHFIAYM